MGSPLPILRSWQLSTRLPTVWRLPATRLEKENLRLKNVKLLMQFRGISRFSREGSTATAQLQSTGLRTEGGSMLFFPHAQKMGSCTTTRHLRDPT